MKVFYRTKGILLRSYLNPIPRLFVFKPGIGFKQGLNKGLV
jgi:hypothetical protein